MENLLLEISELLEIEKVNLSDELESFECWDSLTIFSIIAMTNEKYNVELSAEDIQHSKTIAGLLDLIKSKINI